MSTIPSLLTAAAVLIHSVLGCCWHHCELDPSSEISQTVKQHASSIQHRGCKHQHVNSPTCHDADSGDNDRRHDSDDGEPCDGEHCDAAGCSFIATARMDVKSHIALSRSTVPSNEDCVTASVHAQLQSIARIDTAWRQRRACVRTLTQVWRV